jgi:hypothetical protein
MLSSFLGTLKEYPALRRPRPRVMRIGLRNDGIIVHCGAIERSLRSDENSTPAIAVNPYEIFINL